MNFVNCKRLHLLVNYISRERKIEIPFYHPLNTDSYSSCDALKIITVILMFFVTIIIMLV